jgi:hypothetical protein
MLGHEGNGAVKRAQRRARYDRKVAEAKAKGLPVPPRTMGMESTPVRRSRGVKVIREFGGTAR